jgi:TolB-like protein/DNA-binding winged helix-turn-helix (wHTH) protein
VERRLLRFGVFELDPATGELRRSGVRIRIQDQPLRILMELLAQPGEIVTREELRTRIWGETFVDYDRALNTAIKKLRSALSDSAEAPRFIETIARRGYRFIAPVQEGVATETAPPVKSRLRVAVPAAIIVAIVAFTIYTIVRRPHGDIDSLAVLPFVNLTGNATNEYVSDGLTETLISDLGHIHSLRVISRTTAMQYKNAKKPLPRIASELRVEGIVEGAVLRFGERIRVEIKLIDGMRDALLWSKQYERSASELDVLRRELARGVASQLRARVDVSPGTANGEAQLLYLKGRFELAHNRNGVAAEHMFRQALAKDPAYAAPYAGLTEVAMFMPRTAESPEDSLHRARVFAEKAVELDPALAEAHASLGLALMFLDRNLPAAERAFRRAIELQPASAEAHHRYGQLLAVSGRFDEALREARLAVELDPFSTLFITDYGRALYLARRYDDAIAQYRRVLQMNPGDTLASWFLLVTLDAAGRRDELVAEMRKSLPDPYRKQLDELYRTGGYGAILRAWADRAAASENESFVVNSKTAARYARAGERELAFQWLERSYQSHTRDLVYMRVEPAFDSIRDDPRFAAMLKKVGLTSSSVPSAPASPRP